MVMKKTFSKTVFRTIKSNFARFIAITAVVFLGVAFVAGLGALSPIYKDTISDEFLRRGGANLIVKCKSETGFSTSEDNDEIAKLKNIEGVEEAVAFSAFDTTSTETIKVTDGGGKEYNARVYLLPKFDLAVNPITLEDGALPEKDDEIAIDRYQNNTKTPVAIGDELTLTLFGAKKTAKVTASVANPLNFTKIEEPDVDENPLELIVYINTAVFPVKIPYVIPELGAVIELEPPVTDVYVRLSGLSGTGVFTDEYAAATAAAKSKIEDAFGEDKVATLTEKESYSLALTDNYAKKIDVISLIFPAFFIAVVALVVLTTMTRLIEEERPVIACYRTLGYGNGLIAMKYVGFALICCLIGALLGIFLGSWVLPIAIFPAFHTTFFFPELAMGLHFEEGVIFAVIMTAAVIAVTAYSIANCLRSKPAELLRPRAPKPGKKIFLEHVPFIWKRMSFRYKSTYRNIFRYVRHLLMTVISVAGSTALVLAGFGLRDVSLNPDATKIAGFADTFELISFVVILFAAALAVLVVYNLTNLNIGERKREIATLEVLGYYYGEVAGYIYREVAIMALFGVILGLPLGFGLCWFLFEYLDFGSVTMIKWYSYLITAGVTLAFVALVFLLLFPKIKKIDMNDSLKTLE